MRYDGNVIGKAYIRTICVPSSSVGINAVSRTLPPDLLNFTAKISVPEV